MCTLLMYLHDVATYSLISENHKVHRTKLLVGEDFCEIVLCTLLELSLASVLRGMEYFRRTICTLFKTRLNFCKPFGVLPHFVIMLNLTSLKHL